jgi:hypothetical protein
VNTYQNVEYERGHRRVWTISDTVEHAVSDEWRRE